jgi:hypothetical protein
MEREKATPKCRAETARRSCPRLAGFHGADIEEELREDRNLTERLRTSRLLHGGFDQVSGSSGG